MKVRVKNDTLFKVQPVLSSELPDDQKVVVRQGTEYDVQFCRDAPDHHLHLELAHDVLAGYKTFNWFVHQADIEVVGSGVTAIVLKDTLFKQRPVLSSELADSEKAFVPAGREFELQAYTPGAGSYTKLTLANAVLGPTQSPTWYAYSADIRISGQRITLKVISDTVLKAKPVLAHQLAEQDRQFVPRGTTYDLQTYTETTGNYLQISLVESYGNGNGRLTWYAFAPDVAIEGTEPGNRPQDTPPGAIGPGDRGSAIKFPGFQGVYFTQDPIIASGTFTWGEATHGGTRVPVSADIVYGMIRIAEVMEEIRTLFGNAPIRVRSWYRDPATNNAIGGATMSRHLKGDAVDFEVEGHHPYDVFARLDPWWGDRGGLASSTQFIHIDARGYQARWDYGF